MPIEINNTKTTLIAGNYTFITSVDSVVGMIVRVFNTGSTTQTYTYTDPYNAPVTVSVPASGSAGNPLYVLAASSSAEDSYNSTTGIAAIRLLITGSSVGNAFTESIITTTGAGNWTKPAGVTEVIVECWGGGGAGGGVATGPAGAAGGTGGSYARKKINYSSPSVSINYSIGLGGTGVTGAAGNNGEDTSWDTNVVIAKGGTGGPLAIPDSQNLGANPQTGNVGDVSYDGFPGGTGENYIFPQDTANAGYGARGAGSCGFLKSAGFLFKTEIEYGGDQGPTNSVLNSGGANGGNGNIYAGGGTGASKLSGPNRAGGSGAQGLIRLIYR